MSDFPSLAALTAEEASFHLPSFSFADGLKLALNTTEKAQRENLPIALEVYAYGQVIAHIALPGSTPDNGHWIRRKRNTVLRCAHSSLYMGQVEREKGISVAEVFAMNPAEHAFHGGCIPIFLKGNGLIGAFTISGLHEVEDHKLAVAMLGSI